MELCGFLPAFVELKSDSELETLLHNLLVNHKKRWKLF